MTAALRQYRLGRVQAELKARDVAACLLLDPLNMRYATDSVNFQVMQMHLPSRYAFVPAEGKAVVFDLGNWSGGSAATETVGEYRISTPVAHFFAGPDVEARAKHWAAEIAELVRANGGGNRRLAIDRTEPANFHALAAEGLELVDAQRPMELARAIKSAEEIGHMTRSVEVAELGMARMRAALTPGMTENQLWALLHETNIANGGEWIDCRLLASGERTNPWGQECSDRVIQAGELVGFDTDMVGPEGYCADISRTLFCGPGAPTDAQCDLYKTAVEHIDHNMALLRPGLSLRELAEKSWPIPEIYQANAYPEIVHGIGMCDEYPAIPPLHLWDYLGYDGVIEENMTLCVESYTGATGGREGVKLEQEVVVTADGCRLLSTFPYEDDLMA